MVWCASQGKLLVCVNNKVMLYKMSTTADGRQELVSDCSPVGVQVLCLHLAVRCVWGCCCKVWWQSVGGQEGVPWSQSYWWDVVGRVCRGSQYFVGGAPGLGMQSMLHASWWTP